HLHIATVSAQLEPGESFAIVASTDPNPELDIDLAWECRQTHERELIRRWQGSSGSDRAPAWLEQLVLAADQFIVTRPVEDNPDGKTIIAGYPWFGDWGRDTAIALPGLTLATGRPEIARQILLTFARYSDRGMIPNVFPEQGETPQYNTVDAALWYVEAVRAYWEHTSDRDFLADVFPTLQAIVEWHQRGTRYGIALDPEDGLLFAGEPGSQLTWMDAKIGDWVITPRIGKPIEINALWYNALRVVADCARELDQSDREYDRMADRISANFQRFWHGDRGYCYDVLDTPQGNDDTFRPNQIFAVSLPDRASTYPALLNLSQRQAIVTAVSRHLLTSYGLRSLHPEHPDYRDRYGGDAVQRDSCYHQGPAWGWLIGPFVRAYLQTGGAKDDARRLLGPIQHHLHDACLGTASEIFDGAPPFPPRGAFAQAWSVAEVVRTWSWI
ncbi:MAG: amylo-alpha-1,6-glucosidase, partial [Cyanobacteria bacterium J06648_11]